MTITKDVPTPLVDRPRLSRREDLATVAFSSWLIIGLFVDGWAHNNQKPETFFTPWHGLFYSGFVATAIWMCCRYQRHRGIPVGYGLGFLGVIGFAAGGMVDLVWHSIFGIEVDLEALLSPSHMVLFASGLLILSSPFRAAWSDSAETAPPLSRFLPALLSITLVAATVSFFVMEFSPLLLNVATAEPYRFVAENVDPDIGGWLSDKLQLQGFASILLTTVILLGPALLLVRRWQLPAGSFTMMFAGVAVLTSALEGFARGETILAVVLGGFAGDLLVQGLSPRMGTTAVARWVGGVVPLVMWFSYFGLLAMFYSVGWSVELWSGVTVMAALAGLGLAVLMTLPPPALDERLVNRGSKSAVD